MSQKFKFDVEIVKSDSVRRELHGVAYRGGVLDTANHYMSPETVRKMVHDMPADIGIDVEHNQKPLAKAHARLVEKSYDEATASANVVIKLSEAAWSELVESGKVKGFSIFGTSEGLKPGVAKNENGVETAGKEIINPKLSLISLVKAPANRTQAPLPVAKSDEPAWAAALLEETKKLIAKVEALNAKRAASDELLKSMRAPVIPLRKALETEQDVRRNLQLDELRAQHLIKSQSLEAIWEGQMPIGESRVQAEQRLCRELHSLDEQMAILGKSSSVDLLDPRRSAHVFRGGTSQRLRADRVPSDSGWLRRTKVQKSKEDEIDLDDFVI